MFVCRMASCWTILDRALFWKRGTILDRALFVWLISLSATSQQYFSLTTDQPPATNQQYSCLRTNQHQPSATSQPNMLVPAGMEPGSCSHYAWDADPSSSTPSRTKLNAASSGDARLDPCCIGTAPNPSSDSAHGSCGSGDFTNLHARLHCTALQVSYLPEGKQTTA
jgi:hypothetical protein